MQLLLGQRGVLAGAERRHAPADLVDQQIAHLVDRLHLAAGRRPAGRVAEERVGDVGAAPQPALEQDGPGGLAHLEERMVAPQGERGLLAHGSRQRALDAQRAEALRQRPLRGGPDAAVAAHVRRAGGDGAREREQGGEDRAQRELLSNPAVEG